MPWIQKLYETYCNNEHLAGVIKDDMPPLVMPSHINVKAELTVKIDWNGNFIGADIVGKENNNTIIPVTEDSADRSSNIAPHALCDMLSYVAGDFSDYVSTDKDCKTSQNKFKAYTEQLQKWADSEYSCKEVRAILVYVEKKQMVNDLIKSNIIKLNKSGKFDNSKINSKSYDKLFVRFSVGGTDVWKSQELFQCYMDYYKASFCTENGICYVSGETKPTCNKHPKGIVRNNYNAKLISENNDNFVSRGRFEKAEQAISISYDVSQKAHAALTWLVNMQGVRIEKRPQQRRNDENCTPADIQDMHKGERKFICWNPNGKKVKQPDFDNYDDDDDDETTVDTDNTNRIWKTKLHNSLKGYRGQLNDSEQIVIIALEAATKGRLSVTYYNELLGSDYYDRIELWGETLHWKYYKKDFTPSFSKLIKCAYGTEKKDKKGNLILDVDERLFSEQYQRLLHCMLDNQPIPHDLLHKLFINASNPQKYSKFFENILSTTCAVIVKYAYDMRGEKIEMILDENNTDRSYLFGRILAVADKVEKQTYNSKDNSDRRETNAMRLWSAYVNHPLTTFTTLRGLLAPYYKQLKPASRAYYENLIAHILTLFKDMNVQAMNRPLDENFVLGYYLQRDLLNQKKNENKEEN